MVGTGTASLESARVALVAEFAGVFAAETVSECLEDSYRQLRPARVEAFLPLLAQRFARERLRAAARSATPGEARPPLVLFVCTHNSGRSQLAAALLRHRSGGRVDVASAGTRPGFAVQPEVVAALTEAGVETAALFPKPLTDEVVGGADVVVTMGCGDSCPVIPGRRYLDWAVPDPQGADLATVRGIRDQVATLVDELLATLTPAPLGESGPAPAPAG